jgi:membrane-bound inhibitor of C-type lysozyme
MARDSRLVQQFSSSIMLIEIGSAHMTAGKANAVLIVGLLLAMSGCNSSTVPRSAPSVGSLPQSATGDTGPAVVRATYVSGTGQRLSVTYDNRRQTVTLATRSGQVTLPRAVSASGARYTRDDSEIFWNKGSRASYWRDGRLVFEGVEEKEASEQRAAPSR